MQSSGNPTDSARVYFGAVEALFTTPSIHCVPPITDPISEIAPPTLCLSQDQKAAVERVERWMSLPNGNLVHDTIFTESQKLTAAENYAALCHAGEMMDARLNQLTSNIRLLWIIQDNLEVLFKKQKMSDIKFTQLPILDLEMHPPFALYRSLQRLMQALSNGDAAVNALPLFSLSTWRDWVACLNGYVDTTITCAPDMPAPIVTLALPKLIGELWNQKSVLRLMVMRCPFVIYAFSPTECTYSAHLSLYSVPFEQNVHHAFGYQKYVELINLSPEVLEEFDTHAKPLIDLLKSYRKRFIDHLVSSANLTATPMIKTTVDKFSPEVRSEVIFEFLRDAEFFLWIARERVMEDLAQFPKKYTPEFNQLLDLLPHDQRWNFECILKQLELGLCKDEVGELFYTLRLMAKVKAIQALAGTP